MMIIVYQIKGQMFFVIAKKLVEFIFFLACFMRINTEPTLEHLIINSKIFYKIE